MQPLTACRKSHFACEAGFCNQFFAQGFPGQKNTSIRTTVRIVGIADNECGQCGCSAEKPQRGFFDGLQWVFQEK